MYLKRKIDNDLLVWKQDTDRKPLIIKGVRQIGKSESMMLCFHRCMMPLQIRAAPNPPSSNVSAFSFVFDTIELTNVY